MSLLHLASEEHWQEFDAAWNQLIEAEGVTEELFAALRIVAEKKRIPRCIPTARAHAERLVTAGRAPEAARLLGLLVTTGAAAGELANPLVEHAKSAWGAETWWASFSEIAGLRSDVGDARRAWISFEKLLGFTPGQLVFHPGGWGAGEVTEMAHDALEIDVRFGSGKRDRFPLSGAVEIFDLLPEGDLRAIHFRSVDELKRLLRDEPLHILRAILVRHNGRASTVGIKNALLQVGVEGSAWTAWWRKARKLAENSAWFKVTGSQSKGEVILLRSATDPVQDLKRVLDQCLTLSDLLTRVRNQLASKPEAPLRTMMLEVLAAKTGTSAEPGPVRMAAWLLLRDELGTSPEALVTALRNASVQATTSAGQVPPVWALFQSVQGTREQERCVGILQEVFAEGWPDEALKSLQHTPAGMVRSLVDALASAGKKPELALAYKELLNRPLRAPELLIGLARLAETGKLPGEYPSPFLRAQALVSLASNLFVNRRGDPATLRAQTKISELLTKGKEPLIRKLLAKSDYREMETIQRLTQRGVDEDIDFIVTDMAIRAAPAVVRGDGAQFWENDRIWTTKPGLEKRRAEMRILREVKIPANQEALGRAAAMGDLSENAEWEAAIEDQRTLAQRSQEMEGELRRAELIENAILPENMVCPGTIARYRDAAGLEQEITILGPWDADTDSGEVVVSYRAPLAAGLLGKRAGDRARISLPSGLIEVEVVGMRTVHMEPV